MPTTVPPELCTEMTMLAESAERLDRALHTLHTHVDQMHGEDDSRCRQAGALAERTIAVIREECRVLTRHFAKVDTFSEDNLDYEEELANLGALA